MRARIVRYSNSINRPYDEIILDIPEGYKPWDYVVKYLDDNFGEGIGRKYWLAYKAYKEGRKDSVHVLYREDGLLYHVKVIYETFRQIDFEIEGLRESLYKKYNSSHKDIVRKIKAEHRSEMKELREEHRAKMVALRERLRK